MENVRVKIYALINPSDGKVFYVGATTKSLEKRVYQHIQSAKHCVRETEKETMINRIIKIGLVPDAVELDDVPLNESDFFEDFYMNLFRSFGFDIKQLQKSRFENMYRKRMARFEHKRNTQPKFHNIIAVTGETLTYKYWN